MANRRNNGSGRGFAGMDPERQREIAAMGGRAAHRSGHAHEWTAEEAVEAGHLGGVAAHRAAAFPHDSAAVRQASRHGRNAEVRRAAMRGGTHEQHVHAGRLGAEARWGRQEERWGEEEARALREDDEYAPPYRDEEGRLHRQ